MLTLTRALIDKKRRTPADDLMTSMVQLLFIAGNDTTLISNGTLALLTHPDQLARVLALTPDRWPAAIEELPRFDSPAQVPIPVATAEPVEIAGTTIPAGEPVVVSLLAANRDPARFAHPDKLDLSRTDGAHLAFGHGIHHCVGAPLARLEGRIALQALTERFPTLELAIETDKLEREPSLLFNKLTALPVRLRQH